MFSTSVLIGGNCKNVIKDTINSINKEYNAKATIKDIKKIKNHWRYDIEISGGTIG